jgi:hypothetical protein
MPKTNGEQGVVRIQEGLLEGVEEFLKSPRARRLGLDSKSDVVSHAVRELLKKEGVI